MNDDLIKIANASGYFFQESLRQEIQQTAREHGWSIAAEEHRWCDQSGREGFIDLVLENGDHRMVIEAKRTKGATWVFLVPKSSDQSELRARCLWTYCAQDEPPQFAWRDFKLEPASAEAKFCVIRGQGEQDQPMLERLGGILLRSTESLAEEELGLGTPTVYGDRRYYFPALVTNSQLYACQYDPRSIDLTSGELPEAEFQPVNFIRFRKGLSTKWPIPTDVRNLKQANWAKERTLFIINGAKLSETLRKWRL